MKITSALHANPAHRPGAPPAGALQGSAPATPFESLLADDGGGAVDVASAALAGVLPSTDGAAPSAAALIAGTPAPVRAELAQVQDVRALGFSEAGLLGAAGRSGMVTPDDPVDASSIGSAIATLSSLAVPPIGGAPTAPVQPGVSIETVAASSRSANPTVGLGRAMAGALNEPATNALISRAIAGLLREETGGRSESANDARSGRFDPARQARPATAATQVAVTVTEVDGALQVVAASPGLNPEATAKVRRIVADLVARFGLQLSELHLNGVRHATPTLGPTGANHGG